MPDWVTEAAKFAAGVIVALASVWAARIARGGTLAETLRKEQADIRAWLKQELDASRREHEECVRRFERLQDTLTRVAQLLRTAINRQSKGLPHEQALEAALARLEQSSND